MSATGGRSFGEGAVAGAAGAIQAAVGSGPTIVQGRTERTRTLAPYVALLALLPLLLVLPRVSRGLVSALRRLAAEQVSKQHAGVGSRGPRRIRPAQPE
jgi:hypothetical protein